MKAKKHPLQILETNLEYFKPLVSTKSNPSAFNALAAQLELRIGILISYIEKDGNKVSRQDLKFAFSLLRKYIALGKLCLKNRPQSSRTMKAWNRKAKSRNGKKSAGAGSDLVFFSPY